MSIIACSIPALYPLIKSFLRMKRSKDRATGSQRTPSFLYPGRANRFRFSTLASSNSKKRPDSLSEERILPHEQEHIRKTTDIRLEFLDRDQIQAEGSSGKQDVF